MELSVVIPVFGNERTLQELCDRLLNDLSSYDFEVIFVNDDSTDNSLNILKALSATNVQIKYVDLGTNLGQHKATLEGLKIAKGKKIAVLDADLQDNPALILSLYKIVTNPTEVAYVKRKGIYQSYMRMMTSQCIKILIQLLSGLHYKAGSYYLFDKALLPKILYVGLRCPYPYMSIIVAHLSKQLKYIQADRAKIIGTSGYSFVKRVKAAMMAIYCCIYCRYSKLSLD